MCLYNIYIYIYISVFLNKKHFQVMFVSWRVVSRKLFSKLSFVCLPLGKLVNVKHFPINKKHFSIKKKFDLVFRKVFPLLAMFVF